VLRLLDRSATLLGLDEIGFTDHVLQGLRRLIRQSHGIVLVTGPTGSGKTTTLYGALSEINTQDKNIITIEDPVEYQLRGIGQIQVNPKIDLTFAGGLRAVLRQDPDVIMVGEIRDAETARIAIQAALTGHLVFSTLHTNDAFSAVTRLLDMGVEPFLVSSSVIGIAAQRLVRRLCPECRVPASSGSAELSDLGITANASGVCEPGPGCDSCRDTGYHGRIAIAELLNVDDSVRGLIMRSTDAATIREECIAAGMQLMRSDGAERVRNGQTSAAEVLRVTSEDLVD
jgi:general secretion pathway protein E